jgi:putative ABC transport system substrate-binding protein
MRRRDFITLIGGAAAAWPLAARAQQAKVATIGLLGTGSAAAQSQWTAAFVQRMRDLGWVDGRNLTIEYRWAEGRSERFAEFAAEFVRLKVDVILTHKDCARHSAIRSPKFNPIGAIVLRAVERDPGLTVGGAPQRVGEAGKRNK